MGTVCLATASASIVAGSMTATEAIGRADSGTIVSAQHATGWTTILGRDTCTRTYTRTRAGVRTASRTCTRFGHDLPHKFAFVHNAILLSKYILDCGQ